MPHTPDEWVRALAALPLIEQPGQFWRYGADYSLRGVLLARSSRQDLPQVLHERVLGPLGMHGTGFHADPSQAARLVDCLVWPGSGGPSVLDPAAGSAWLQAPSFPDGAGGLLGIVDDVLTFGRALLTADAGGGSARPWLSPTSIRAMTSERVPAHQRTGGGNAGMVLDPDSWGFGVGVRTQDRQPARYGWAGGLGTFWYCFPEHDIVAVAVTQCVPPPMPVLDAFFNGLDQHLSASA